MVALAVSPGFEGDTITFTGESYLFGQRVKVRETMSRLGERQAAHKVEVDTGKGVQVVGEDACRR
jgi:hypothetical protein